MPENDMSLGTILKHAREAAEMTQSEVADALNISKWTYIALENGRGYFHSEWIERVPEVMRNPVVRYFQRQHRLAISELDKMMISVNRPAKKAEPVKPISRPTASSPSV